MRPERVYVLFDKVEGIEVRGCFEALEDVDRDILSGADWTNARFRDVWFEWAGQGVALKLTLCGGEEKPILGLVRPGNALAVHGRNSALRDSLLETAPAHRYGAREQRYQGIGRVLVARLIDESRAQGAEGRVLVRPVRDSTPFYRKLGFRDTPMPPYLRLETPEAEAVLQACTPSSIGQGGTERDDEY